MRHTRLQPHVSTIGDAISDRAAFEGMHTARRCAGAPISMTIVCAKMRPRVRSSRQVAPGGLEDAGWRMRIAAVCGLSGEKDNDVRRALRMMRME